MPNYQRRPVQVEAFQYDGRPVTALPGWLRDYEVYNTVGGAQKTYANLGVVYVPRAAASALPLIAGAWAVLEDDVISVYSATAFAAQYEKAPEPVEELLPEEPAAPAPTEETPAPEGHTKHSRTRHKASGE